MFVDLTIYGVPVSLLREFGEKTVRPHYPGGVNEAIKDLLRKAILNHDMNQENAAVRSILDKPRAAEHG